MVAIFAIAASIGFTRPANGVNLTNPGFDADNASSGDVFGASGWTTFNFAFTTEFAPPLSSPNTLKIFGPFFQFGGSGVVQGGFAASEGQVWEASAYALIDSRDAMDPQNLAVVKLEFLNSSNTVIGFAESPQITTTSLPADTWQQFVAQGTAPAGTTSAQIVLVHVQLDNPPAGGAIFFDNAAFGVIPEPHSAVLGLLGLAGLCGFARRRGLR
jgi:MYXO-CTERM domain-containing protein